MCVDFRKLNELQPEVQCADSETGGNISLVPLPKIDEMCGRLKGAKVFSILDLRSGYYHIGFKESKCDFFKKEIHSLGHLISEKGIHPLPEKLDTIHNMPKLRNPKEIKEFLGLYSYYRKFVPHFSDISRPLLKLT